MRGFRISRRMFVQWVTGWTCLLYKANYNRRIIHLSLSFQKRKVQFLRIVKWKKLSMKTNLLAWKNWRLNMLEMRKSLMKLLSFPAQNIHHLIFPGTDVLVAIRNAVSMEVGQSRLVEG
jgi:hypothetical protein